MSDDPTAFEIDFDPLTLHMRGYTAHGNRYFDVPFISQIDGDLWQGGCQYGLVLPPFIQHVISLYKWERYTVEHELSSFLEVTMYDSAAGEVDIDQLIAIAQWVNTCAEAAPTLVHCQAGLNRSSLVAGTALIISGAYDADLAIQRLRDQRSPACLCNPLFEQTLHEVADYAW